MSSPMRAFAFVVLALALPSALAWQLAGRCPLVRPVAHARGAVSRMSEGAIPGVDPDEVEQCVVESENPAEAAACADPPLDPERIKADKWDIPGYLATGEGKGPTGCRRGTHGLEECLAEAENAKETEDCFDDYGVPEEARVQKRAW